MPEPTEPAVTGGPDIVGAGPGLRALLAEANATWAARAGVEPEEGTEDGFKPGWRAFEDAFPTFYQFTNRPR
jgi:hypothetical protein